MFGAELSYLDDFSLLEKLFIRVYGSLSEPTVRRFLEFKYSAIPYFRKNGLIPEKILDFGCAFGGFGFFLAGKYPRSTVHLFDADADAAHRCKTIIQSGSYSKVSFLNEFQLDQQTGYSLLLLIHVLEHVQNDLGLLEKAYEKLAPGGLLYIGVPRYTGDTLSELDKYVGHVRTGYKPEELKKMCEKTGFVVIPDDTLNITYAHHEPFLVKMMNKLTATTDKPLLDFGSLSSFPFWKKAGLALLWPFFRTELTSCYRRRQFSDASLVFLCKKTMNKA